VVLRPRDTRCRAGGVGPELTKRSPKISGQSVRFCPGDCLSPRAGEVDLRAVASKSGEGTTVAWEDAPLSGPAGRSACHPDQVRGQGASSHTRGDGSYAVLCSLEPRSLNHLRRHVADRPLSRYVRISSGPECTGLMNVAFGPRLTRRTTRQVGSSLATADVLPTSSEGSH
jgi:hypothetical protein